MYLTKLLRIYEEQKIFDRNFVFSLMHTVSEFCLSWRRRCHSEAEPKNKSASPSFYHAWMWPTYLQSDTTSVRLSAHRQIHWNAAHFMNDKTRCCPNTKQVASRESRLSEKLSATLSLLEMLLKHRCRFLRVRSSAKLWMTPLASLREAWPVLPTADRGSRLRRKKSLEAALKWLRREKSLGAALKWFAFLRTNSSDRNDKPVPMLELQERNRKSR